jgi:KaiC/GvpD/RAD55 family RecA-like ATPase
MNKDYSTDLQRLFLEVMLQDAQNYVRVQNIFNPDNFDRGLKATAEFIKDYSNKYASLPTHDQVHATTGVTLKPFPEINEDHSSWFLTEFEGFTKKNELSRAILKAADLLDKGEYDPVEKLIKEAVQISLTKDMGTDYFADPKERLMRIKSNKGQASTGWPTLDSKLFGGMSRGELNIFAGGSGSGKSLFMQNIAVNWIQAGLNGVYLSLELSEELCSMRIDSMVANCSTKEIFKNIDDVELKVKMAGKKCGKLQIKYMPAQSTVNDIRAYLKELHIQTGLKADFIMVDYLDLLMPVSAKVSPNDLFVKDKYVSEELRNLAREFHILMITASQLNRSAVEEVEFDHSHISGGISKINTADNVFGIFTSRAMRERGRYQIQLMKTRSSSGVGQKVELEFDVNSLRIIDMGEDAPVGGKSPNALIDQIKAKSTVNDTKVVDTIDPDTGEIKKVSTIGPKISVDVQSTKLKTMLAERKAKASVT